MREVILELLKTLPPECGIEERGDSVWMRCPVHADGRENTPSFKISLNPPWSGSCYCFGCGVHGPWAKTATLLGFKASARFIAEERASSSFSDDEEAQMLGRKSTKNTHKVDAAFREHWPVSQRWRGVPGALVDAVGGKMVIGGNGREPVLRLSVLIRGVERGYIDCAVCPREGEKKYINAPSSVWGKWGKDALYPFDFVCSLEPDVVAIVEGPRDALITIRNGLPALATLGSTSWSEKCVNLIMSLAPKTVLLMLDPDEAGDKLMRRAYSDLSSRMHVVPVVLPSQVVDSKRVKLKDPGDLNRKYLQRVLDRCHVDIDTRKLWRRWINPTGGNLYE